MAPHESREARGTRGRWTREHLPAIGVFVLAIAAWEMVVWALHIQFYLLPAPHVIVTTLKEHHELLLQAALFTFQEALMGFALGCGLGVLAAAAASRWPDASEIVLPYAVATSSVPIIALAPLAIVWFGVDRASKIAIVGLMTFFPTFISTLRGLLSPPPSAVELMRSYAASDTQIFIKLRLPASLPYMFTAFKVCTTSSMIGAVVGEYFGGRAASLGVYIKSQASLFHTREAWAAILMACLLGIAFYLAVALVERCVVPWHVTFRRS
ncbi:ABC transporter permease [Pendulispora albinea]|uniref:ABC transporter permease n=1 Tax=Pendulispora albinea TaxID=2741071 RepID=A0ABZ2M5R0_9BACT